MEILFSWDKNEAQYLRTKQKKKKKKKEMKNSS